MGSFSLSRRNFAVGSAAALAGIAAVSGPAKAAQYSIRCGSIQPNADPVSQIAEHMFAAIEKESGGRIHIDFFPDATLGGDQSELQQLRAGAIQMLLTTAGNLSSVIPLFDMIPLGFAFSTPEEAVRVFDGAAGDLIRNETSAKGMHSLHTFWDSGMFQIASNTHPIKTPDDLHGFKLRVTSSKITLDLFKELGAIGLPLSGIEVYSSLQTHLIDGEASPLITIESFRFYELNKYIALTNHAWGANIFIMNGDFWKGLPPDLQALVERVCTRYGIQQRAGAKQTISEAQTKLHSQGITFNSVDQAQFRARLGTYYTTWANTFGPAAWGALQSSLGRKLT